MKDELTERETTAPSHVGRKSHYREEIDHSVVGGQKITTGDMRHLTGNPSQPPTEQPPWPQEWDEALDLEPRALKFRGQPQMPVLSSKLSVKRRK